MVPRPRAAAPRMSSHRPRQERQGLRLRAAFWREQRIDVSLRQPLLGIVPAPAEVDDEGPPRDPAKQIPEDVGGPTPIGGLERPQEVFRSHDLSLHVNNTVGLARTAGIFDIPLVLTNGADTGPYGPLFKIGRAHV